MYNVYFSKRAEKDKKLLKAAKLDSNAKALLNVLILDPYQDPPPYEKLVGSLSGYYSRRISYKHRLVYSVDESKKAVLVERMWTQYDL